MSINDIECQDRTIDSLQRAIELGRLANSYIFAGPDGVGRFKLAFEWAKALLCLSPLQQKTFDGFEHDSCGQCESCKLMESGGHPDFKHVYKELIRFTKNTQNRNKTPIDLPKDVVNEFLIEQVVNKPKLSGKTVYIVSEAEKLNAASQNALLKTLEEPPAFCVIILLCTRLDQLLPTTLSRCQVVKFGSIDEDFIVEKLREEGVGEQEATFWARFTEGSLGDSLQYAKLDIDGGSFAFKKEVVDKISRLNLPDSLDIAEWFVGKSKEISKKLEEINENQSKSDISRRAQKILIRIVMSVYSDAMKLSADADSQITNLDQVSLIQNIANSLDPIQAAENVEKAYQSINWVESSVNEKLIFEELLLNYASSGSI